MTVRVVAKFLLFRIQEFVPDSSLVFAQRRWERLFHVVNAATGNWACRKRRARAPHPETLMMKSNGLYFVSRVFESPPGP